MNYTIKIAHLNVQSIKNKTHEINYYINKNNIDILNINESFLNPNEDTHLNILKNFKFIRNDRKNHGGGSAIYINNKIKHSIKKIENNLEHEITTIELDLATRKILLINIYTHPKSKTDYKFLNELIKNTRTEIIILGDFNALHESWFCENHNKRGQYLEELINENN